MTIAHEEAERAKLPHFDVEQVVQTRILFDLLRDAFIEHSYQKDADTALSCGLAAQACEAAATAIFEAMNVASSYADHPAAAQAVKIWTEGDPADTETRS